MTNSSHQHKTHPKSGSHRKSESTKKSSNSLGSIRSVESIGIGASEASSRLKVVPDGFTNQYDRLYDCVVGLIYCPAHRNIAICRTRREHIVWIPFVQLRDAGGWTEGVAELIRRTIGRQDPELDSAAAEAVAPKFSAQYFEITQIQAPSVNAINRVVQLITLEPSGYKCCGNTRQLEWCPLAILAAKPKEKPKTNIGDKSATDQHQQHHYGNHWGPELRDWCAKLQSYLSSGGGGGKTKSHSDNHHSADPHQKHHSAVIDKIYHELTVEKALKFFAKNRQDSPEQRAILGLHFKIDHALEFYEDYLKHCYPSTFMNYESFRMYMIKYRYNVKPDDSAKRTEVDNQASAAAASAAREQLPILYDLFRQRERDYLDFHELFIALIAMDPQCKDRCEARIRLLFRHYAERLDHFTDRSFRRMIADMYPRLDLASSSGYQKALQQFAVKSPEKITFTTFYRTLMTLGGGGGDDKSMSSSRSNNFPTNGLLRFARSVIGQASPQFGHHRAKSVSKKATISMKMKRAEGDGDGQLCLACGPKTHEYGMNVVTIDTLGRCVNPRVINEARLDEAHYPQRRKYSLEFTFSDHTIGNVCLDLVKALSRAQNNHPQISESKKQIPGVNDKTDDDNNNNNTVDLLKYLLKLCRHMIGVLHAEPKLIKLNGPTIVVGDLYGNLHDLIECGEKLFPAFPAQPESLLFLGNYSGEYANGIECLIYVFAMKVMAPDKVFLLRGNGETRAQSGRALRAECFAKYGRRRGTHAFEAFNGVFARLPIAAIVDDCVLCAHSGIPRSGATAGKRLTELAAKLPAAIDDVARDSPPIFEILTRYPRANAADQSDSVAADSKSLINEFMNDRDGDLGFHSAPIRSSSIRSYRSKSFSEKIKSQIKSGHQFQPQHHHRGRRSSSSSSDSLSSSSGKLQHRSHSSSSSSSSSHSHSSKRSKSGDHHHNNKSASQSEKNRSSSSNRSVHHHHSGSQHKSRRKSSEKSSESTDHKHRHAHSGSSSSSSSRSSKDSHHKQHSSSHKSHSKSGSDESGRRRKRSESKGSKEKSQRSHDHHQKHSSKSNGLKKKNFHSKELATATDAETFDGKAFEEFMSFNRLQMLIRGSSICKHGYMANFHRRCLTVISCANVRQTGNGAAAIVINREAGQVRCVVLCAPNENDESNHHHNNHSSSATNMLTKHGPHK